jgi:hypothetical protein
MIDPEVVEAYNNRVRLDLSNIGRLTPAQKDRIKHYGSQAEALLTNRDLAQFIHHWRFEQSDALINITRHDADSNGERVALANQLSGVDSLVQSLRRAVANRNRVLAWEQSQAQTAQKAA